MLRRIVNGLAKGDLRDDRHLDFAQLRYTGGTDQVAALRVATFNGTPHAWLDGVKAVNPEAYFYWYHALGARR